MKNTYDRANEVFSIYLAIISAIVLQLFIIFSFILTDNIYYIGSGSIYSSSKFWNESSEINKKFVRILKGNVKRKIKKSG